MRDLLQIFSLVSLFGCAFSVIGGPEFTFTLQSYTSTSDYICPEGWFIWHNECYKVFTNAESWDRAADICTSYGGSLATVQKSSLNLILGIKVLSEFALWSGVLHAFWIGYECDSVSQQCHWHEGESANVLEGFWASGEPDFGSGECVQVSLIRTTGQFRWSHAPCQQSLYFVCQLAPCVVGETRCTDGRKCVSDAWQCDRFRDCDDGSDEGATCADSCGEIQIAESGEFQSPNYPQFYDNYADCSWNLESPLGTVITLQFEDFEIEQGFDMVHVYDGWSPRPEHLLLEATGDTRPRDQTSAINRVLVTFTSDYFIQKRGFHVSWKALSSSCGGPLLATEEVQWFSSPDHPEVYPDYLECQWDISTQYSGAIITLMMPEVDIGSTADSLVVYDDGTLSDKVLLTAVTTDEPKAIMSSSEKMLVTFNTDRNLENRIGFNISYRAGCSVVMESAYGTIQTPGYDVSNYPNGVECSWTVRHPLGLPLSLVFEDFAVEATFDFVTVYTSSTKDENYFQGFYSTQPPNFLSEQGTFYVTFSSDLGVTDRGWKAFFTSNCEDPYPLPPQASVDSNQTEYGASVVYNCGEGYSVQGINPRICGGRGLWLSEPPECVGVLCPAPDRPENGLVVDVTGREQGGVVVYSCVIGYNLVGEATATCDTGVWSGVPTCEVVTCTALDPEVPDCHLEVEGDTYGDVAHYTCNYGFVLVGDATLYCTENGTWSADVPICIKVTCADPAPIMNGVVIGTPTYNFSDTVQVACDPGYVSYANVSTCLGNSAWDTVVGCHDFDECEAEPDICGIHECVNIDTSYTCSCASGYVNAPGDDQTCIDIDECSLNNGGCDLNCTNTQGSYYCVCIAGYELYDGESTQGGNLQPFHSCLAKRCPCLMIPDATLYASSIPEADGRYGYITTVDISCNYGYTINGTETLQCLEDGQWSDDQPFCYAASCPDPEAPEGGSVSLPGGAGVDSLAHYDCDQGYMVVGSATLTCQGQLVGLQYLYFWAGPLPRCTEILCSPPVAPALGYVDVNSTMVGSRAVFWCDDGYELEGLEVRICGEYGEWSGYQPVCTFPPACLHPGLPVYGSIIGSPTEFPEGSVIHFQCDIPGYELTDTSPLFCGGQMEDTTTTEADFTTTTQPLEMTTMIVTSDPSFTTIVSTTDPATTAVPVNPDTTAAGDPSECTLSVYADYDAQAAGSVSSICRAEYGLVALQQFRAIMAQIELVCVGQDVNIELVNVAQVSTVGPEVQIIMSLTVAGDSASTPDGDITACTDSLASTLTSPGALSAFPDLHTIDQDSLSLCTVPLVMDPVLLVEHSRTCTFDSGVETTDPIADTSGQWCHTCANEATDDLCAQNGAVVKCQSNQEACETEIRRDSGMILITKRCKQLQACENNALGNQQNCPGVNNAPFCFYCCQGYLCNANLPRNPIFPPLERRRRSVDSVRASRVRRATDDGLQPPQWDRDTPQCVDTMPPEFVDCPPTQYVSLGPDGSAEANFSQPIAVDNSLVDPRIIVNPADVTFPVIVFTDKTIIFIAADQSGNTAACVVNIVIMDETPPTLDCPATKVEEYMNSTDIEVVPTFPDVEVSDASGIASLEYVIPGGGSTVIMRQPVTIEVLAVDNAGNNASCTFDYVALPEGCPAWSLGFPAGGDKACSANVEGGDASGFACHLRCPFTKDFVYDPDLYICVFGGSWIPNNFVPDCTDKLFPDYFILLQASFEPVPDTDCTDEYTTVLEEYFDALVASPCGSVSSKFQLNVSASLEFFPTYTLAEVHIYFEVVDVTDISPLFVEWCAGQLLPSLFALATNEINLLPASPNCTNISNTDTLFEVDKDFTCPPGHTYRNDVCLACTAGMYSVMNGTRTMCVSCPQGMYQPDSGEESCLPCPDRTSTLEENAKNLTQCVALCNKGHYSENGLTPCNKCPIATYQPGYGSTDCIDCPEGTTTAKPGKNQRQRCKGPCWPGTRGWNGLAPCRICPRNHYSEVSQSLECHECPPGLVTEQEGTNSSSLCILKDWCAEEPCENNSTCMNEGRIYRCECPDGFTGDQCDIDIDDCLLSPCANNGTCEDLVADFSCECPAGYSGRRCDLPVDLCDPQPCLNGVCHSNDLDWWCVCFTGWDGQRCENKTDYCEPDPCENGYCISLDVTYSCDCMGTGYEGRNCSEAIDFCELGPCENEATCVSESTGFNCSCPPGFTGERCQTTIDFCDGDPCGVNGRCDNLVDGFECICQDGFTGTSCEVNIDDCLPEPCLNNATCEDAVNYYVCHCVDGFEGTNCQTDMDNCTSSPCSPGGQCVDGVNSFQCVCYSGFQGVQCESDVSACLEQPCDNAGTCLDGPGLEYTCQCLRGYTGANCSTEVDECEPPPCLYGQCQDQAGGYTCVCDPGYTGVNCDVNIDECLINPCENSINCTDLIDGALCSCMVGYAGARCQDLIDNCAGLPCENEGTCLNEIDSYSCQCVSGYTGVNCESEVDECLPEPCENNGTCTDLVGVYSCDCPAEYEGTDCEVQVDHCLINDTCENGATCQDAWDSVTCLCATGFTGDNCEKAMSSGFDLYFLGLQGSVSLLPEMSGLDLPGLSVCYWVRYAVPDSLGVPFLMINTDITLPVLVISDEGILMTLLGKSQPGHFVEWHSNDGDWHHFCFSWQALSPWYIYVDGQQYDTGNHYVGLNSLQASIFMTLGHDPRVQVPGMFLFQGDMSQARVYSRGVTAAEVALWASSCDAVNSEVGDVADWQEFGDSLFNDVSKREPSICGTEACAAGYTGTLCDIAIDKSPPGVVSCPDDIKIVNNASRLVEVDWVEPVFTDDVGIVNITQNYRPGQALGYGEYFVTYTAYDAQDNSAVCEFTCIVLPYDCEQPPPPENGLVSFGIWEFGQFASIRCKDNTYDFVEFPPPFYKCGPEGAWDPPSGDPFRFPACASVYPPVPSAEGSVTVDANAGCADSIKNRLERSFIGVIKQLDNNLGLCSGHCDYSGVYVECDDGAASRRRKRQTETEYNINFNIAFDNVPLAGDTPLSVLILQALKEANLTEPGETITAILVNDGLLCGDEQVLNYQGDRCVNCPVGSYFVNSSCELCPKGSYSEEEAQTNCTFCPAGETTNGIGITTQLDCYAICGSGQYYEVAVDGCQQCEAGYYQDRAGADRCRPCGTGQTTASPGAVAESQCTDLCVPGEELVVAGTCELCPVGTYREAGMPACAVCDYGYTTAHRGSVSSAACNIVECPLGSYAPVGGTCQLCPPGSYQGRVNQATCVGCPPGSTTPNPGAVLQSQCSEPLDPCLGHTCHLLGGECHANGTEYVCSCQPGWVGDGVNCTDVCTDYCENDGVCQKNATGFPVCYCPNGYQGMHCDTPVSKISAGTISGIVIGSVVAMAILIALIVRCCPLKAKNDSPYNVPEKSDMSLLKEGPPSTVARRYVPAYTSPGIYAYAPQSYNDPAVFVVNNNNLNRAPEASLRVDPQSLERNPYGGYMYWK